MSLALVILLKVIHRCVSVTEVLVDQVSPEPQETFSGKESASATCDPGPFLERGPINGHEHFEYLAPPRCYKEIKGVNGILLDMLVKDPQKVANRKAVRKILKEKEEKGADPETIRKMQFDLEELTKKAGITKEEDLTKKLEKVVGTCQLLLYEIVFKKEWRGEQKLEEMKDQVRRLVAYGKEFHLKKNLLQGVEIKNTKVFTYAHINRYDDMKEVCATLQKYIPRFDSEYSHIDRWCKPFFSNKINSNAKYNPSELNNLGKDLTDWFLFHQERQIKTKKDLSNLADEFNELLLRAKERKIKDELKDRVGAWDIETLVGFKENELSLQLPEKESKESGKENNRLSYLNMATIRNELLRKMVEKSELEALQKFHECTISHYNMKTSATEWIVTTGIKDKTHLKSFISQTERGGNFHFLQSFTRLMLLKGFDANMDLISMENLAGIDFTGSINEGRKKLNKEYESKAIEDYVRNMHKVLYGSTDSDGEYTEDEDITENPTKRKNGGFKLFVENNKKKLFFRVHMYENLNYSGSQSPDPFYAALYKVLFDKQTGLMTEDNKHWLHKVTFVIGHSNTIKYDKFVAELIEHQDKVAGIQINWNMASNQFLQDSYSYEDTCLALREIKTRCEKCRVILGSDGIGIIGTKASIQSQREYIASKKDHDSTQAGNNQKIRTQ